MKKKHKNKRIRNTKSLRKFSKGYSKLQLISVVVGIIFIAAAAFFFINKTTTIQKLNPFAEEIAITKPRPDLTRARKLTIDPEKDTVMQVTTKEKVKVSLIVPKGAIRKKETVEMIPYYYNAKSDDPSAGVIISPASVSFNKPVTLLFDLSESQFKTDAPKNQRTSVIRYSGSSQVLTLDKDAKELIPVLVARELETSTQLRARILGGGGYVFTTQPDKQLTWAKHAFTKEKINAISLLESANALLSNKQTLSKEMRSKAEGAALKIFTKKNPPASEIYAALVTKKLLHESKVSLVGTAYAIETSEGFFLAACKLDGLSIEQYVGYAKAAQLMGYDAIGENCLVKAKNLVTRDAERIISNPTATLKEIITVLQDVQFLGLDEESQLDESLIAKARQTAENEAKKVADDPNATDIQAALELQKLQAFGVEGNTTQKLEQRLTETVEKKETPQTTPEDYGEGTTIEEEQILTNQAMSIIGIEMLKIMGIEELDEASLKKRFSEMAEGTAMLNEAAYAVCLELGGEDCESKHAQAARDIENAIEEGYSVAEDIGTAQSQEYDDPEYDSVELYIEPTEDPSSGGEENVIEENHEQVSEYESSDTATENNPATENYETTEVYTEPPSGE